MMPSFPSGVPFPVGADEDSPVFVISVAAPLGGRAAPPRRSDAPRGLVSTGPPSGEVQRLSQEEGVNLAGIKRIISLENQVTALQARIHELTEELASAYAAAEQAAKAIHASYRHELVPVRKQTALVVWKPQPRRF